MSDYKSALIKNRKKVRMFYVALICTSFFSLIITLLANVPREYKYLFSLPLTFMVVLLFSLNYFLYPKMTYGYAIYFTLSIMLIRYSVSPIMTVISNNYIGTGPQPTYLEMDYAFIMMIYELIVSYTVIIVSSRYYYRKLQKYNINSEEIILYKPMFILKVFTFISVLYLMIFHKGILVPDIISIISDNGIDSVSTYPGYIIILSNITKLSVLFLLVTYLQRKFDVSNKNIYVYLTVIVFLLYLVSVASTDRSKMIETTILILISINILYPKKSRMILILIITTTIISFLSVSIYKFSVLSRTSENPLFFLFNMFSTQFELYFAGPRLVAQSMNLSNTFGNDISILTLFNDFLGSVPFLAKFIDQTNRINVYFNIYNYRLDRTTLVIPMVGIGYNYFTFIFAPVFTALFEFLSVRFDYLAMKTRNLEYKFIFWHYSLATAFSMSRNTQSMIGIAMTIIIPAYILFKLNNKISLRKKG